MALLEFESMCERQDGSEVKLTVTCNASAKMAEILSITDDEGNLYMEDEFDKGYIIHLRERACEEYLEEYGN